MKNSVKNFLIYGLFALLYLHNADSNAQNSKFTEKFLSVLPTEIQSWRLSSPTDSYLPDNLYDYIDGGAELYLSYGFRELLSVTYEAGCAPPIRVDIFDMGDSQNAFGLFTHSRETVEADIGQGSQYFMGLLLFWKDRYFVSVLCSPESDSSRQAVWDLGRRIESAIIQKGKVPGLINRLLPQDLDPASIKYFKHPVWLNTYYFISNENLLQIDQETECVLARYEQGLALIVVYAEETKARSAFENFTQKYYLQADHGGEPVQLPDGRWGASRITGSSVIAVFDAREREHVNTLIDRLEKYFTEHGGRHEKKI